MEIMPNQLGFHDPMPALIVKVAEVKEENEHDKDDMRNMRKKLTMN